MNAGIARAARMPRIATTIISSMSVKPDFFFSSFAMGVLSVTFLRRDRRIQESAPKLLGRLPSRRCCTAHAIMKFSAHREIAAGFQTRNDSKRRGASPDEGRTDKKRQLPPLGAYQSQPAASGLSFSS